MLTTTHTSHVSPHMHTAIHLPTHLFQSAVAVFTRSPVCPCELREPVDTHVWVKVWFHIGMR